MNALIFPDELDLPSLPRRQRVSIHVIDDKSPRHSGPETCHIGRLRKLFMFLQLLDVYHDRNLVPPHPIRAFRSFRGVSVKARASLRMVIPLGYGLT